MKTTQLSLFLFVSMLFVSSFFIMSCKNKNTPSVSQPSFNPFDTSSLETQTLSAEDRTKLASAAGRTVQNIEADVLATRINNSTGKLFIYCFWNTQNEGSISTVKALNVVAAPYDSTKLKLVFVNMNDTKTAADITLFIRENQLTEEALMMKTEMAFFAKKIRKDLTDVTTLPVLLMINKAEETFFFYNKIMDEKELSAMLTPLVL